MSSEQLMMKEIKDMKIKNLEVGCIGGYEHTIDLIFNIPFDFRPYITIFLKKKSIEKFKNY